ncbi:VOC family protein [Kitasatospora cathayae]|uniref:VOC family protein n=1 Tax=Kitasatospora cathayae TaxID=3004092 RepID=A0ABY7PZD8_9ACTN|nr:VOC family protein [Kitasatospora sp. HUAS 3-15]WBP85612.1 VOC family protein [Kitasatospora sp. HUAS 3-15]
MPKAVKYHEGVPCWIVLTTPDLARAERFYGALFGWEFVPTGPAEAVATRYGAQVAAITSGPPGAAITAAQQTTPQPAAWTTCLASRDLNRTAAAVRAAGGRIVREPYQVPDQGRAALAVDPLGAPFGLWQGGDVDGAGLVNEPGTLTWNEHLSPDPDAARAFYRQVFEYGYDRPRAGHTLARVAGLPACSIGPADPPGATPGWRTHFGTADTDRATADLRALGGTVRTGPGPTPFGRVALVRDDAGAEFVLVAVPPEESAEAA